MDITFYTRITLPFSLASLKKNIEFILTTLKKKNAILSIHFVGDKKMTELNKKYRGKNKTTDVLSFALQEGELFGDKNDLGDIFICIAQVKRQAKEYKISFEEEFYRMTIHGILHVLGYDHMEENDAKKMFSRQEKLLQNVYGSKKSR